MKAGSQAIILSSLSVALLDWVQNACDINHTYSQEQISVIPGPRIVVTRLQAVSGPLINMPVEDKISLQIYIILSEMW